MYWFSREKLDISHPRKFHVQAYAFWACHANCITTFFLERFSIECSNTKAKVITLANHDRLEANTCSWHQARENTCDQVTIGFSLASDWLRKWLEFFEPIRAHVKEKRSKRMFTFDTQLKTTLLERNWSTDSLTIIYTCSVLHSSYLFSFLYTVPWTTALLAIL